VIGVQNSACPDTLKREFQPRSATSETSSRVIELRQILAGKFPGPPPKPAACLTTGVRCLDEPLCGGLPKGAITELVSTRPSAGSALVTVAILCQAARDKRWVALIDGRDCFDPQPLEPEVLSHLLWVRCGEAVQAIRAADLLLRDGNLPLVVLDLHVNPAGQLRKIPSTIWYRLQRIVEQTASAFLVITPQPMVGSARAKLSLKSRFTLDALEQEQPELLARVEIQAGRMRKMQGVMVERKPSGLHWMPLEEAC
jgi:hypothetical protein